MPDTQPAREMSPAELRDQLQRHRGGQVEIVTRGGDPARGHVYTTVENDVVLVEDPANMIGIHVIPLDRIERIAWGRVSTTFFT